jgi:hypothetical protein
VGNFVELATSRICYAVGPARTRPTLGAGTPDIRRRAGLVLATQRHITGAGEARPSLHGRRHDRAHGGMCGRLYDCGVTSTAAAAPGALP